MAARHGDVHVAVRLLRGYSATVRIALLSPYSWTYPGGVTRHIEALAGELTASGHEPRILSPFDPDDALSVRLHRGARPQQRSVPEQFVSLGRTVGIPANGAVSNMALSPHSVFALRRELQEGGYDVVHIHEPVVPLVGWDALCSAGDLPRVGTFHTYSENTLTNGFAAVPLGGRRRMNHLHVRIAVSEAAAWTARRFYGGRYRIIPNGVHLPAADGLPHDDGSVRGHRAARVRSAARGISRRGHGLRAAAAADPVHRSGRRTQGAADPAACVRSAARARAGHAHPRRRLPRGGRPHDARRPGRACARQGLRAAQALRARARRGAVCALTSR